MFSQLVLTIEAGRRCDSGPGSFVFETPQAEKIFFLIQATIKQKTSLQNQEGNTPANSPQPKPPDMGSMAAALHNTLRVQDRKYAPSEDGSHAPITLMPLPSIPTNACCTGNQEEAIYADPVDCIQSEPEPQAVKALYVDPASILPIHPPGPKQSPPNASSQPIRQDSVYSEVYDSICTKNSPSARDEPIYSEPVVEKGSPAQSKPDPFAHLYAQVHKAPAASGPSLANATQAADDVIYENMGII